jgi:hypothetical protein
MNDFNSRTVARTSTILIVDHFPSAVCILLLTLVQHSTNPGPARQIANPKPLNAKEISEIYSEGR